MSTIKANNYEASTAGNNLIFKTNNAERMRIDTSGNLTLSSGNLTLSSGSLSGTVQRGSYGSLSVGTSTNGYSGIDFTAASATFMIRTSDKLSGVYKGDDTWAYYIDGSGNYYSGGGLCPQTTQPPTLAEHLTRKDYVDSRTGATVYTVAANTSVTFDIKDMLIGETRIYTSTTATTATLLYCTATGSGGYVTICGFTNTIYTLTGGSVSATSGYFVGPSIRNGSWSSSTSAALGQGIFSVTITRRA